MSLPIQCRSQSNAAPDPMPLPLQCRSRSNAAPFPENAGVKRPPFPDQMKIETDFYKINASRLRGTEFSNGKKVRITFLIGSCRLGGERINWPQNSRNVCYDPLAAFIPYNPNDVEKIYFTIINVKWHGGKA